MHINKSKRLSKGKMMEIECPECGYNNENLEDYMPDRACDSNEFECANCEHTFLIGWYAEAELR